MTQIKTPALQAWDEIEPLARKVLQRAAQSRLSDEDKIKLAIYIATYFVGSAGGSLQSLDPDCAGFSRTECATAVLKDIADCFEENMSAGGH